MFRGIRNSGFGPSLTLSRKRGREAQRGWGLGVE